MSPRPNSRPRSAPSAARSKTRSRLRVCSYGRASTRPDSGRRAARRPERPRLDSACLVVNNYFVMQSNSDDDRSTPSGSLRIIRAEHLGMCFGVRDAIALAHEQAKAGPLTILGDLVHNATVSSDLRARGIAIAHDVSEVRTPTVMVTAH